MKLSQLEGIIPNRTACFELMCLLENEYNCTLKLWLDANNPRGGEIGWYVYCAGTGSVFDHDDVSHFIAKSRVLDAHNGSLYSAVWSCLLQLESKFRRIAFDQVELCRVKTIAEALRETPAEFADGFTLIG
jgi:hypothetical protein